MDLFYVWWSHIQISLWSSEGGPHIQGRMNAAANNFPNDPICMYLPLQLWLIHRPHPTKTWTPKGFSAPHIKYWKLVPLATKDYAWKELVSKTVGLFLIIIRDFVPLLEDLFPSETDCSWKCIKRLCISQTWWCRPGNRGRRVETSLEVASTWLKKKCICKNNFIQVWKVMIHVPSSSPSPPRPKKGLFPQSRSSLISF